MTANFPIAAAPQGQGSATITATLGGVSQAVTLTVAPRPVTLVSLQISPAIVTSGAATTGTITLSGAAPAGAAIAVSSGNTAVATVPASVPAGGATTVNFTITTVSVGTAVITATFGNSLTAVVTAVKTKEKDKDKDKDKEKEKEKDDFKERKEFEKLVVKEAEKVREVHFGALLSVPGSTAVGNGLARSQATNGRAFIRADERRLIAPPG